MSVPEALSLRSGAPLRAVLLRFLVSWAVLSLAFTVLGLVLVDGVLAIGDLADRDAAVNDWLADNRTLFLDRLTGFLSWIMDGPRAVALTIAIVVLFAVRHRRSAAMLVAVGLPLEAAAFITVNQLVGRPRPDVPKFSGVPSTSSFPSGHVAATLVVFGALALIAPARRNGKANRLFVWLAVLVTIGAAFSRVYRGLHHVTDVAAGMALGACALAAAVYVVTGWEDHRAGNQSVELGGAPDAPAEGSDDVRQVS
jgi:membrane-associated phospholipid phosphatase